MSDDNRQDEIEKMLGIPGLGDRGHRADRAPEQEPEFGHAPEGFVDEIVCVETESYSGIGYCDDESDEEGCYVVYPEKVLVGGYFEVHESAMRLATKNEVGTWFDALTKERASSGRPETIQ